MKIKRLKPDQVLGRLSELVRGQNVVDVMPAVLTALARTATQAANHPALAGALHKQLTKIVAELEPHIKPVQESEG